MITLQILGKGKGCRSHFISPFPPTILLSWSENEWPLEDCHLLLPSPQRPFPADSPPHQLPCPFTSNNPQIHCGLGNRPCVFLSLFSVHGDQKETVALCTRAGAGGTGQGSRRVPFNSCVKAANSRIDPVVLCSLGISQKKLICLGRVI